VLFIVESLASRKSRLDVAKDSNKLAKIVSSCDSLQQRSMYAGAHISKIVQ
jgi:hypothetical protein